MVAVTAFFRRHWKILVPVGVVGLAVAYYLVFIFFAVHLLFVDDKVDEGGPVFTSGAVMTPETEAATETEPGDSESDGSAEVVPKPGAPAEAVPKPGAPAEADSEPDASEPGAPAQVVRLVEGDFVDRSHPTEGVAVVLNDGTQQRFLRFEDFATDNGPDLNVYLSSAPADASAGAFDDDFVDLGDLKGNIGAQNYEIPADVDLSHHSTVVIWCVRFSVAFGAAELS